MLSAETYLQRHQLRPDAGSIASGHCRCNRRRGAAGFRQRHDPVAAVARNDHRTIVAQRRFEQFEQPAPRNGLSCLQRDAALNAGIDRIVQAKRVAQHRFCRLSHRDIEEIESDIFSLLIERQRHLRYWAACEVVRPLLYEAVEGRLVRLRCVSLQKIVEPGLLP